MAVPERPKKRKRPPDEDYEDEDAQEQGQEVENEDRDDASEIGDEEDGTPPRRASRSPSRHARESSHQHTSNTEHDSSYDLVDDLYPSFFRLPRAYEGNNDDLMPEDTDEEALERVLDEEEELNAEDIVAEGGITRWSGDPDNFK